MATQLSHQSNLIYKTLCILLTSPLAEFLEIDAIAVQGRSNPGLVNPRDDTSQDLDDDND